MDARLPKSFYTRNDVVVIGRELVGKTLCTRINGAVTRAMITETEAYAGVRDRASHAYGGKRTARTEPMFAEGGIAYVYLCYGIHHLFNVVTNVADTPDAVLIRAAVPVEGEKLMQRRRRATLANKTSMQRRRSTTQHCKALMAGPGSVAQALGITTRLTGTSLLGTRIWIEDAGFDPDSAAIRIGPRVGVGYAGPDARRPYRFVLTP